VVLAKRNRAVVAGWHLMLCAHTTPRGLTMNEQGLVAAAAAAATAMMMMMMMPMLIIVDSGKQRQY